MRDLITIPRWIELMRYIFEMEGKFISKIMRRTDCGFSHTYNIFEELETRGWITKEKKGRQKIIKLTEKGRPIAEACFNILT